MKVLVVNGDFLPPHFLFKVVLISYKNEFFPQFCTSTFEFGSPFFYGVVNRCTKLYTHFLYNLVSKFGSYENGGAIFLKSAIFFARACAKFSFHMRWKKLRVDENSWQIMLVLRKIIHPTPFSFNPKFFSIHMTRKILNRFFAHPLVKNFNIYTPPPPPFISNQSFWFHIKMEKIAKVPVLKKLGLNVNVKFSFLFHIKWNKHVLDERGANYFFQNRQFFLIWP